MKSRVQTDNPPQAVKLTVLLGVYCNGVLGHMERYADLKSAHAAGRDWEKLDFQVVIRWGVSRLPDAYPYTDGGK